jgi:hypothetical protein
MHVSQLAARACAATASLLALLAAAPAAESAVNVNTLASHTTELEAQGVTRPCARVNVVIARGTSEAQNISPGLDGWYYDPASWSYKTGPKSPYGAWNRIARELFVPTDGSTAYTSPNDVLRTDVTFAASLDLLTSVPSGTVRLMNYLTSVHARCGSYTRFVLLGFSQGGLVVTNAVAVPSRRVSWPSGTQALTAPVINQIAAIGTVADTGFNVYANGASLADRAASQHAGSLITSGYAAGTMPDVEHAQNDGNYDPAFTGLSPRPLNGFPVKTAVGAPAGSVVDSGLSENVALKLRSYCFARDWACQNTNPNQSFTVHTDTAWHQSSKQNLAIWAIDQLRNKF